MGVVEWTEWTNFEPRIQCNLPLHLPTTSGDGSIETDDIRRNAKKGHLLKQHQGTFSWTSGPESDGQHQKDTQQNLHVSDVQPFSWDFWIQILEKLQPWKLSQISPMFIYVSTLWTCISCYIYTIYTFYTWSVILLFNFIYYVLINLVYKNA